MIGRSYEFPPDRARDRRRAGHLAWLSIALLTTGALVLFFAVGNSQAMKTAWVSDILTAAPPIALLIAMHHELKPPSLTYPYGYSRAVSIAFLVTAAVLLLVGLELFYESAMKLVSGERPAIGTMVIRGHHFWAGWAMIAALTYSMAIGILLGALKGPVARRLQDKELEAEAKMNQAEWMSEGAAIIGILLVGFGHWWGDAAAALIIAVDIIFDGWQSLRQVIGDLMDESPSRLGTHEIDHELHGHLREAAERLRWVDRAAVRLREHGHVITGEVFVVPNADAPTGALDFAGEIERASDDLRQVDWRLNDIVVVPVPHLESQAPPRT